MHLKKIQQTFLIHWLRKEKKNSTNFPYPLASVQLCSQRDIAILALMIRGTFRTLSNISYELLLRK